MAPQTAPAGARVVELLEDLPADPLGRLEALLAGPSVPAFLLADPVTFDVRMPGFASACGVEACAGTSSRAGRYCTPHEHEQRAAKKEGISEVGWLAAAVPKPSNGFRTLETNALPACEICPERDAPTGGLCKTHYNLLRRARLRDPSLDRELWTARQTPLRGYGDCRVQGCPGHPSTPLTLCARHEASYNRAGRPGNVRLPARWDTLRDVDLLQLPLISDAAAFAQWCLEQELAFIPGQVDLRELPPLVVAEIRWGMYAHTVGDRANWHPSLLRTLVRSCLANGVESLLDIDVRDKEWTTQPGHVNRIVKEMSRDLRAVRFTREETRLAGYIDPLYWGVKFRDRASPFNLTSIPQQWLREVTWDVMAEFIDGPSCPRTAAPLEQMRRSVTVLGTWLDQNGPQRGAVPELLTEAVGRDFVVALRRICDEGLPLPGVTLVNGNPSMGTSLSLGLILGGCQRVLRAGLDLHGPATAGLSPRFVVAIPFAGPQPKRKPRPLTDEALAALVDETNLEQLKALDTMNLGASEIWQTQIAVGRRISEILTLRLNCVSVHFGRPVLWHDQTKVGQLDASVPIPQTVYELLQRRQTLTRETFRLTFGRLPSTEEEEKLALFASPWKNPKLHRSVSYEWFNSKFGAWLEGLELPGVTTHQARHRLATDLIKAGASLAHVRRILGHVSERMSEHYIHLAMDDLEMFLRQVWVSGPGSSAPGTLVASPGDADPADIKAMMLDLTVISTPTEGGVCTFQPVVNGGRCPHKLNCNGCDHFALTGADLAYWKRKQEQWTTVVEGAPTQEAVDYLHGLFEPTSHAIAGLETALQALGLLDQALALDIRAPQDYFDDMWSKGWRARDLEALAFPVQRTADQDKEGVA